MIRFFNGRTLTMADGVSVTTDEVWTDGDKIAYIGPTPETLPAFERQIDLGGDLVMPGFKNAHAHAGMSFVRSYADDVPLAAMFLVMSAHRATYLYGASSSEKRNLMPTYALQWEAIRTAKTNSCAEYDLFGVAPCPDPSHPMYGLYKFKQGFGGELFRQMGCWDYPLNEERYDVLRACEMRSKGYYR